MTHIILQRGAVYQFKWKSFNIFNFKNLVVCNCLPIFLDLLNKHTITIIKVMSLIFKECNNSWFDLFNIDFRWSLTVFVQKCKLISKISYNSSWYTPRLCQYHSHLLDRRCLNSNLRVLCDENLYFMNIQFR